MTGAGIAGALVSIAASAALATSTPWIYEGAVAVVMTDG
jgi:hypothetical protein